MLISDFNGRATDAVLDTSKGLRWSCPDCRKRDIDSYKLFTETRNSFSDWGNNLGCLCDTVEKVKITFDEWHYIDHSSSSPADEVTTRSAGYGMSPPNSPKSDSLIQVSAPTVSTMNVSVSAIARSIIIKVPISREVLLVLAMLIWQGYLLPVPSFSLLRSHRVSLATDRVVIVSFYFCVRSYCTVFNVLLLYIFLRV